MEILKLGSSGEDVKRLKERLVEFGFYKGKIDGEFGEETEAAVKTFQDSEGLADDGIVGLMTQHALDLLELAAVDEGQGGTENA